MLNLIVFGFLFVVVLVCCFLLFDLLISGPGSLLLPRFLSNVVSIHCQNSLPLMLRTP